MVKIAARPEAVEVDLERTAVIVVDMQNAFATKGGAIDLAGDDISGADRVIEVHHRLLGSARKAGVRVIYLQMTYQPDLHDTGGPNSPNYHKEVGPTLMRKRPELEGKILVDGTWDWQIVDGLEPQPGDLVVPKTRYSGFSGTNLQSLLRTEDIRYLLFTGIATNVCVESTARDAFFGEFWPILVEDAMNHTGPDFCREATLWNFEHVFGWVTRTESLIEIFDAAARPESMEKAGQKG